VLEQHRQLLVDVSRAVASAAVSMTMAIAIRSRAIGSARCSVLCLCNSATARHAVPASGWAPLRCAPGLAGELHDDAQEVAATLIGQLGGHRLDHRRQHRAEVRIGGERANAGLRCSSIRRMWRSTIAPSSPRREPKW